MEKEETKLNKKIGMIILAVILIILATICIIWFAFPTLYKTNEAIGTAVASNKIEEDIENVVEKEQEEIQENTQTNSEMQTTVEQNEQVQNITENNSSETFEESPKTEEEKAIEIAKKDYGNAENVKFSVEGIQADGRYIVSVRDSSTTEALVYYTIQVSSGEFEKREMN